MIYFIQQGEDGPVKIGYARTRRAVKQRFDSFQIAHAERLELLAVHPGTQDQEKALHAALGAHRIRGEWFRPHGEVFLAAGLAHHTAWLIDRVWSDERWRRLGVLTREGCLTNGGADYVMTLERELAAQGFDLDRVATDLREMYDEELLLAA